MTFDKMIMEQIFDNIRWSFDFWISENCESYIAIMIRFIYKPYSDRILLLGLHEVLTYYLK